MIDPGIGFGKTLEHNLELLNRLNEFCDLNLPIMVGTSRKSFIGKILNKEVEKRLAGTLASICMSVFKGAHVVRVHDIEAVRDALLVTDSIIQQKQIA